MSRIEVQRSIPQKTAAVWEALADIGAIHRFHPAVATSPLTGARSGGIGATRTCTFYDGNTVDERVVAWEEGKRMDIRIDRGSMPFREAQATLEVEPDGAGSRVRMVMEYRPKYGILGRIMDALMMRPRLRGMMGRILHGLEHHLTTGQVVGPNTLAA